MGEGVKSLFLAIGIEIIIEDMAPLSGGMGSAEV
jgi:hypothetical protein